MTDVVFISLILAPIALTFLLKSNAALGFLALCLGFVLSTSVIGDLRNLLSQIDLSLTDSSLALTLLVAPLVLTLLLTRKSYGSGIKRYLQLVVALCAGVLLVLSLEPVLNLENSLEVASSDLWDLLENLQSAVIGVGALLSLLLIWTSGGKHSKKRHK